MLGLDTALKSALTPWADRLRLRGDLPLLLRLSVRRGRYSRSGRNGECPRGFRHLHLKCLRRSSLRTRKLRGAQITAGSGCVRLTPRNVRSKPKFQYRP